MRFINRYGFTIVEIMIVIVVIGILAIVAVVGYGAWRESVAKAEVQSDLKTAFNAMEQVKNFGSGYPAAIPSNFKSSPNVEVRYVSGDGDNVCIEAVSLVIPTISYFINTVDGTEPVEGTCAGGPGGEPEEPPGGEQAIAKSGVSVAMSGQPGSAPYVRGYVCGVMKTSPDYDSGVVRCTTNYTSASPFGSLPMASVEVGMQGTAGGIYTNTCGVRKDSGTVTCVFANNTNPSSTPFGSTEMSDVSTAMSGQPGSAPYVRTHVCGITMSSTVLCSTSLSSSPLGSSQVSSVDVGLQGSSGGFYTNICGINKMSQTVTCNMTSNTDPSVAPFGSTKMLDMSVAMAGTPTASPYVRGYVCGIVRNDSTVQCVTGYHHDTPFGSTQVVSVDVGLQGTTGGNYLNICAIAKSSYVASCIIPANPDHSTPFGSTQILTP